MTSTAPNSGLVEFASSTPFGVTLERVAVVIEAAGMKVFARIDHAAAARDAGLSMPPATVLIYGNAKGGTPIMLESPAAALDLPLRVLVRETGDGRSAISFRPISLTLQNAGVTAALAKRLAPAQTILSAAVEP